MSIEVWEPRWHDRTVLVAAAKVRDGMNEIRITKSSAKFNGSYFMDGDRIRSYPLDTNGKLQCYAVNLDDLMEKKPQVKAKPNQELVDAAQKIDDYVAGWLKTAQNPYTQSLDAMPFTPHQRALVARLINNAMQEDLAHRLERELGAEVTVVQGKLPMKG